MVLAILAVALAVVDVYVRHQVEQDTAARIEQKVPGSHASVQISLFPFLGRVAASGTVPELTAEVTGVTVGGLSFSRIDVDVHDLRVSRSMLLHGQVVLQSVRTAVIHATVTQAALDRAVGLPVTLGAGTVGLGGAELPAQISISNNELSVTVSSVGKFHLPVPVLALLPCLSSAAIDPGMVVLTCTTTTLPPALANTNLSPQ